MNSYYLGIDLSGTGTTSIFDGFNIYTFFSKEWKEHFNFIQKIRILYPLINECIIFEEMRPLQNNVANADMVSYAKLLGAIEIKYKNIFKINSFMIKNFKGKIRRKEKNFDGLIFKTGRAGGWFWNLSHINEHEVDAIIIYYYRSAKKENYIRII
ncbi:hypothetical protein [Spiroplasma diminutum]|uniref:Uncharacterized protein n=1 Tax=Spiroplasma diminutum CUAS-1 TaxID=1276221 RepID=S5LWL5_9MOLU|nr:hypothetical protein [Spiroplasma diminutum]AGR42159.1 hypothetical protein SDIMI_v3c04550 [Spiroplasma diminutum CUAS-1]